MIVRIVAVHIMCTFFKTQLLSHFIQNYAAEGIAEFICTHKTIFLSYQLTISKMVGGFFSTERVKNVAKSLTEHVQVTNEIWKELKTFNEILHSSL